MEEEISGRNCRNFGKPIIMQEDVVKSERFPYFLDIENLKG